MTTRRLADPVAEFIEDWYAAKGVTVASVHPETLWRDRQAAARMIAYGWRGSRSLPPVGAEKDDRALAAALGEGGGCMCSNCVDADTALKGWPWRD